MIYTLDLCSGIGGIALGLERAGGFKTVAFCEIDSYCRKILAKHWPEVPQFEDVYGLTKESLSTRGIDRIDCITAGFPCQPFSCAGKRQGAKDERFLWPEIARLVCEIRPEWVLLENVPGLLSIDRGRTFGRILSDLARSGYDAEWDLLPAAAFGAPHLRFRLFLVAYTDKQHGNGSGFHPGQISQQQAAKLSGSQDVANSEFNRLEGDQSTGRTQANLRRRPTVKNSQDRNPNGRDGNKGAVHASSDEDGKLYWFKKTGSWEFPSDWPGQEEFFEDFVPNAGSRRLSQWDRIFSRGQNSDPAITTSDRWAVEPDVGRVAHGIPSRVDRLKCLGNAVVPQVAEWIGKRIMEGCDE